MEEVAVQPHHGKTDFISSYDLTQSHILLQALV